MDLVRFAIRNPVKVTVGVILLLLFGAISLATVPVQLTPDVDRPTVTVRTEWPGRSPQEIEQSILLTQEDKLKSIQGLWKMTSTAQLGTIVPRSPSDRWRDLRTPSYRRPRHSPNIQRLPAFADRCGPC